MTGGEIRKLFEATPFLPFRVHMDNDKIRGRATSGLYAPLPNRAPIDRG